MISRLETLVRHMAGGALLMRTNSCEQPPAYRLVNRRALPVNSDTVRRAARDGKIVPNGDGLPLPGMEAPQTWKLNPCAPSDAIGRAILTADDALALHEDRTGEGRTP